MESRSFLSFILVCGFFSGCSMRTLATRQTALLMERGMVVFETEPDPALARAAMPAQLKMLEGLLVNDPNNMELLGLLVQGYSAYAYLFVEDEYPARAKGFYARAKDYGLRLLSLRRLKPDSPLNFEAWKVSLGKASRKNTTELFWTANAWGFEINLSRDDPTAVADLPIPAAMIERVRELNPGYYHGGADAFLGFYHASRPKMLGGLPEKAKKHFQSSLDRTGGKFLLTKVLMARSYAVQIQDRALFERLLGEVLHADPGIYPAAELANAIARRKAKRLLERVDELF